MMSRRLARLGDIGVSTHAVLVFHGLPLLFAVRRTRSVTNVSIHVAVQVSTWWRHKPPPLGR